jgi:hypothetical protein
VAISFTDDYAVEIFPDHSLSGEYTEHWRFLKPTADGRHFVITGEGIKS